MATDVRTWARLRSPIGNDAVTIVGDKDKCNIEYTGAVFVSADGNTPMRTYWNPYFTGFFFMPFFTASIWPGVFVEWHAYLANQQVLPDDQKDELIGGTVALTGGSFTMTSSAFQAGGQTYGTGLPPIVSITYLALV